MRILHLTHTDIRFDNRIIKEIECLTSIYDVFAIGIAHDEGSAINNTEIFNDKLFILQLKFRRKVKWLPRFIIHLLIFIELFWKSMKIIKRLRPSVLHCHDTLVLPIGFIYKVMNPKAKLIYDAHELESNKNGQTKIVRFFILFIEKIVWSNIDYLITVSPSIDKWYLQKFSSKKSVVILNSPKFSVSSNNYNNRNANYFHEKYSLKSDTKIFIYLGALVPGRYIENLLKIFSEENSKSVIVFIGYGELKNLVQSYQERTKRIKYHPPVTHDKVVETIMSADVGLCLIENVSLSDYYSLPNKLFEYAFAGKKILGSAFPDISSVIEKYNLGYCCKLDDISIKQGIEYLENINYDSKAFDLYELSWEFQEEKLMNMYNILHSEIKNYTHCSK